MSKRLLFFMFFAVAAFAGAGFVVYASPGALPAAMPAPLPEWNSFSFPAAGGSYQDAASDIRVWRVTDGSTPATSDAWRHSGVRAGHISRTVDGVRHFLLFENAATGEPRMAEFRKGSGISDHRSMAGLFTGINRARFSNVYAYGLYYVGTNNTLYRYDVNKRLPGNWDMWPKNLAADSRITSQFGSSFSPRDLQVDGSDAWFTMRIVAGGSPAGILGWNAEDDRVCTLKNPAARHFQFAGTPHVLYENPSGAWRVLDLTACSDAAANITFAPDAVDAGVRTALMRDPATLRVYRYDPAARSLSAIADIGAYSNGDAALSAGWVTQAGGATDWAVFSSWSPIADIVQLGFFEQVTFEIWVTPEVVFERGATSVEAALHGIIGAGFWLAKKDAFTQMVPGSFFWDAASRVLYIMLRDGTNPTGVAEGFHPRAGFQGIVFTRHDGSDTRFLAHHFSRASVEGLEPRAQISPDGSLVMWTSDMYGAGRHDVFLAETPISPPIAPPFPLPEVDLKINDSDGPLTVQCGDALEASWITGNNPDMCTASGPWSGARSCEPSTETLGIAAPPGTHTYSLEAQNEYGAQADSVVVHALEAPPEITLKANNSETEITVPYGSRVTLSWYAEGKGGPVTCIASGDWSGQRNCGGGMETTSPLLQERVYIFTLSASDICGAASKTVFVRVLPAPQVDLKANNSDGPVTVPLHTSFTLSWATQNNPALCTASGDWSGSKSCSGGSETRGPFSSQRTLVYELTATNGFYEAKDSVTVEIASAGGGKLGDLNADGCVNVIDLGILLSNWNKTGPNIADINGDQIVNVIDLGILLSNWGC